MYHTILVPTDLSEPAEAAWAHARSLAQQCKATIVLLYVAESVLSHFGVVGLVPSVTELEEQHDVAARLKLQELAAQAEGLGLKVRHRVAAGKPWQKIVETAGEEGADLIVIGTHGRTGFAREAIGSTAERVVRQAHCPVLVVRAPAPK
jgi:nucleotide-binding universal stress UspA family protein